jgi:hypothetical protein
MTSHTISMFLGHFIGSWLFKLQKPRFTIYGQKRLNMTSQSIVAKNTLESPHVMIVFKAFYTYYSETVSGKVLLTWRNYYNKPIQYRGPELGPIWASSFKSCRVQTICSSNVAFQ